MLLFSVGAQVYKYGIRITLWWPKSGFFRKKFMRFMRDRNVCSLFLLWGRVEIAIHIPFKIVSKQAWEDYLKNPLSPR